MKINILIILLFFTSCSGELFHGPADHETQNVAGQKPAADADPIIIIDTTIEGNDEEPVEKKPVSIVKHSYLTHAGVGSRCTGGSNQDYIVLSDEILSCQIQAQAIDAHFRGEALTGIVVFEKSETNAVKEYCFTDKALGCDDVSFEFNLSGNQGTWRATIQEKDITQTFTATDCDFDAAETPIAVEVPASDISITEVAFYQGVKIPVFANGQFITQRNAPIIAKRQGLVRVFVNPKQGVARPLLARLKIGTLVKEVIFTPAGIISSEGSRTSTINFILAKNELPSSGEFSVSLFETEQCSDTPRGTVGTYTVPNTPQELDIKTLAAPLRIMLVPFAYYGDNSGRVPQTDATVVKAFQDMADELYPVHEVEIEVRSRAWIYEPVISPNGAGFSQALNFCMNQRQADNVDDDVYYYCMFQPAATYQEFCSRGCTSGIATVANSGSVDVRGGIGISFGTSNTGTMIHEIGHALGRPHAPCGNVSGVDPNYPYQGGSIGSYGYSILTGEIFSPSEYGDFMGYCDSAWVSDYTYQKIYTRFSEVLGLQQNQIETSTREWKSAILDIDGELKWDISRQIRGTPSGERVRAETFDLQGNKTGSVDVYITKVAHIDTHILIIEETNLLNGKIVIPQFGSLNF